mgnify:CR=1 FL=1
MKEVYMTSEAERKYRKKYYEQHREEILRKKKEKYNADPEKNREKVLLYARTHDRSEYFREYYRRKKELKKNLKSEFDILSS